MNNTSQTKAANRAHENIDWDALVNNYNKASLKERETTRDNVTSYVKEKLNIVSQNIDTKVLKALTNASTVDPDMYKHYTGSLAGGIRDTLNATINGFEGVKWSEKSYAFFTFQENNDIIVLHRTNDYITLYCD